MSSRGAFGAPYQKHKSQNVNSVYSGKNTAASKASGPSKHGGLQALGRTTTIVRRMPKPATLPSLKAEHGQDPHVCLVPQGSQGWLKSSSEQPKNSDSKISDGSALPAPVNGPDLRPNWAKQNSPETPPAGGSASSAAAPGCGGNGPNGSPAQQSSAGGGGGGGEYPTLAAAMKFGAAAGSGEEPLVSLPNVIPPQPAGYIGASGPRVSDRKLPSRYYGGPESARPRSATGQKKYDFMQKMAKLSLDLNKEPPAAAHANSKKPDVKYQLMDDDQPPIDKFSKQPSESGRAHSYDQPGYDRQRLSASESTTDSTAHHNKHRPPSFDGFGGGSGAEPEDAYHLHSQHLSHRGGHPKLLKHNADGLLPSGERPSGRGDTGFSSQLTNIQQHQNPSFADRHAAGGYAGRDGYGGVGGGGGGSYRYGHSGSFHHSESGSYENNDEQLYRNDQRLPAGYGHENSGWVGDELVGKPPHQRPTRQPLLSQPQAQPQQQQMHYRVDSRHTNNSDSDGSGWNASIGNFSTSTGRRGGGSGQSNGVYPAQHQSSNWYGGSNGGGSGYPPSLMSLETGAIDANYDGRYNRQQPAAHSGGYGGYGGGPRNGPVTGAYAQPPMDEQQQQFGGNAGHAAPKSGDGSRVIGTVLSDSDSAAHGYLSNDFFGREHGSEFENEKGIWERSYGAESFYNKRSNEQQPQQPTIRMLKRNDEKSAEYFAYYATPDSNSIGQSDASNAPANTGTVTGNSAELPSYTNAKKPLLTHKSKTVKETHAFEGDTPSSGGYREFHRRESQSAMHGKKNAVDVTGQSFNCGATVNPTASHQSSDSHSHQKFNRAPGGGKSLQSQTQQPQQSQQRNSAKQQATDGGTVGKVTGDGNLPPGTLKPVPPAPPENVWEKRKEERLQAERKGLTARQRRQLDQHFPPMSETAKIEANETPALANSSFIRDIPRNQDVRLEQKSGFGNIAASSGGNSSRGFPHWNPPTLGAESHWDEALKPTSAANGRQRNNNGEQRQQTSDSGPQLGANYGTRREFVNSKNRGGSSSGTVGGGNAVRGLRGSKSRGGVANTVNRSGDGLPRQVVEGVDDPPSKTAGEIGDQQLSKEPTDVEQDNFSNMGEFHAEDYKIESTDRTKAGQRMKNFTSKPKLDKDGRTRRGPSSKRTGDAIGRQNRQDRGGNRRPNESLENGDSNTPNDTERSIGNDGSGRSGRQTRTGGQRSINQRRVGAGRTGAFAHQTRGQSSSTFRGGGQQQRSLRSNTGGAAFHRSSGGDRPPPSAETPAEAVEEPTPPTADLQQNGSANDCANLADRSTQLKSPVISDGGQEEWETASESSDFGRSDHQLKVVGRNSAERESGSKPNGAAIANGNRAAGNRCATYSNGDFVDGGGGGSSVPPEFSRNAQAHPKTAGQKNVKPASHTFQSNADSANRSNNNKRNNNNNNNSNTKNNKHPVNENLRGTRTTAALSQEKIARDGRKEGASSFPVHDGLAGVDINDASVVVIDHHLDLYNNGTGSSESAAGDFEEVLSKKTKRQRLQQLEAECRRLEREKERQDKLQAKRTKQLQRRAERNAAKKATENKKEAPSSDRITVFTNQNYLDIGVDVFDHATDEKSKETLIDGSNGVASTEKFLSQPQKGSPGDVSLVAMSTGLDEITMTTVWNSTLVGIQSADTPAGGPVVGGVIESLTKSVIPSPIARPAPKKKLPISSNTWSSDGLTASNKTLVTAEKFDFTFDPTLKSSLKGSSVDGGLDSAEQIPLTAKSRYDSMRRSCSPGRGGLSADTQSALNGGLSVLSDLKSANSSSLIENSDHAQLQKKLDRVKDFWPGALSSNGFASAADVVGDVAAGRMNVAKVKPQPAIASTTTSTVVGTDGRAIHQIHPLSPIDNKPLGTKDYGGFSSANISLADYNSLNGFIPMSSATSQSPSAAFGLGTGLQTIPPYQIMFRNGEFITQSAFAHSANSPPTQNIIGQPSGGIVGTQQRSSRPNSFIEHTLIMTQQPNGVPTTPWSTGGGSEFLNGINATPPPPIAASTPGSGMGRSSNPSMAPPPAIGSVIGHHPYAAPPPPPQLAMVGQPPGKMTQIMNYPTADYGIGEPLINFSGHHLHAIPPPAQITPHLSHAARMAPPPAASNPFGAPPSHRSGTKPTALLNGVPPPPPSMSVPPPPTHLPPPPYYQPPPGLRMAHIPPPVHPGQHPPPSLAAVNWPKQSIQKHNAYPIDQYRTTNTFNTTRVPHDFSAPPPPLNGTTFVGAAHAFGDEYRATITDGRNGAGEKVRPSAERKTSGGKNGSMANTDVKEPALKSAETLDVKPRCADVATTAEV